MPAWLISLDRHFPIRYLTLLATLALLILGIHLGLNTDTARGWAGALITVGALGVLTGLRDLTLQPYAVTILAPS